LRLMEELGKASDAMIRMYSYTEGKFQLGEPNWRQMKLEAQLADVFSWLFGLVEKLGRLKHACTNHKVQPDAESLDSPRLSEIIWRRYGSDDAHSFFCPFCKGTVCSCPIVLVPATKPAEELKAKFQY